MHKKTPYVFHCIEGVDFSHIKKGVCSVKIFLTCKILKKRGEGEGGRRLQLACFEKWKSPPDCAMKDIRVLAGHIVVVLKPGDFFPNHPLLNPLCIEKNKDRSE